MDTIRALETAARLQSYSAAAREMNLTHGAISHRLRALEKELGETLFVRKGNTMHPTAECRRLAGKIRQALDILELEFGQNSAANLNKPRHRLVISVVPALATYFLADRLPSFSASHPLIELDVRPNPEIVPFKGGAADFAIRYGRGPWLNTDGIVLPPHELVAVASPTYAKTLGFSADANVAAPTLEGATLLRHRWRTWQSWSVQVGLKLSEPIEVPQFDESVLQLRAAQRGDGVALTVKPYASDLIASGELVQLPFAPVMDTNRFHLLWEAGQKPYGADILGMWLENAFRQQD